MKTFSEWIKSEKTDRVDEAAADGSINVGDKVAYSTQFLKSTGEHTGPIPFARGVVKDIRKIGGVSLATVEWDTPEAPEKVNVFNLVRVDRMHLEPR